jgi:hypothetical protein
MDQKIGSWAFIIGVILAILGGVFSSAMAEYAATITLVLVILGLIVGFLNIGDKEVTPFLIAAIALMLVKSAELEAIPEVGSYLVSIVNNIAAFVAPAALIVALIEVYRLAGTPKGTAGK